MTTGDYEFRNCNRMWNSDDYFLNCENPSRGLLAELVYPLVFRTDFSRPGFCLIQLSVSVDSLAVRQTMVDLKCELDVIHWERSKKRLKYMSMGRFDQQATTRPHRENAPVESVLMLGYEPSAVQSKLSLLDHARCAHDNGMTTEQWLIDHNPMYVAAERLLQGYRTELGTFDTTCPQILLLNNSHLPFDPAAENQLGVLHTAEILNPDPNEKRIVNSTMIGIGCFDETEIVSEQDVQTFLTTHAISERMHADSQP